jgi:hypothetical protein
VIVILAAVTPRRLAGFRAESPPKKGKAANGGRCHGRGAVAQSVDAPGQSVGAQPSFANFFATFFANIIPHVGCPGGRCLRRRTKSTRTV